MRLPPILAGPLESLAARLGRQNAFAPFAFSPLPSNH